MMFARKATRSSLRTATTALLVLVLILYLARRNRNWTEPSQARPTSHDQDAVKKAFLRNQRSDAVPFDSGSAKVDGGRLDPDDPASQAMWGDDGDGAAEEARSEPTQEWPMRPKKFGKEVNFPVQEPVRAPPSLPLGLDVNKAAHPDPFIQRFDPGVGKVAQPALQEPPARQVRPDGGANNPDPVQNGEKARAHAIDRDGKKAGAPGSKPRKKPMMMANAMNWKAAQEQKKKKQVLIGDDAVFARLEEERGAKLLLAHPLVARFATGDLKTPSAIDTMGQAGPQKYNLSVCTLVTGQQRFLPEWIVYHKLLGVDNIVLYDSAQDIDVDSLAVHIVADEREDIAQSIKELKGRVGSLVDSLDDPVVTLQDRIRGIEAWIDSGAVTYHFIKPRPSSEIGALHDRFLEHCSKTYSQKTNWLARLGINEFLVLSDPLYGPTSPYQAADAAAVAQQDPPQRWRYPLLDLLERPPIDEAGCLILPQVQYRNYGVRELTEGTGVLETQTKRDVIRHVRKVDRERVLLHTSFSSQSTVFEGPHACRVPRGTGIKSARGFVLQDESGDAHPISELSTEPLSIAFFPQRDLADCLTKLAHLDDPESIREKGTGTMLCETFYLPSPDELASSTFPTDPINRFLARRPTEGSVVDDKRIAHSFVGRATKVVLSELRKAGLHDPPAESVVSGAPWSGSKRSPCSAPFSGLCIVDREDIVFHLNPRLVA